MSRRQRRGRAGNYLELVRVRTDDFADLVSIFEEEERWHRLDSDLCRNILPSRSASVTFPGRSGIVTHLLNVYVHFGKDDRVGRFG